MSDAERGSLSAFFRDKVWPRKRRMDYPATLPNPDTSAESTAAAAPQLPEQIPLVRPPFLAPRRSVTSLLSGLVSGVGTEVSGDPAAFTSGKPWGQKNPFDPAESPPPFVSEGTMRFVKHGQIPSGGGVGMADYDPAALAEAAKKHGLRTTKLK